jgi:hypothetical protein
MQVLNKISIEIISITLLTYIVKQIIEILFI